MACIKSAFLLISEDLALTYLSLSCGINPSWYSEPATPNASDLFRNNGQISLPILNSSSPSSIPTCFIHCSNLSLLSLSLICRLSSAGMVVATSTAAVTSSSSAAPTAANAAPRFFSSFSFRFPFHLNL